MVTHFGKGTFYVSLFTALHFLGILFSSLFAGALADKKGKRILVIASQIIGVFAMTLFFVFDNILLVAIGIFLSGYSFGSLEGNLTGVLADTNQDSDKVINYSQRCLRIGTIVAPLILLTKIFTSWKMVFW